MGLGMLGRLRQRLAAWAIRVAQRLGPRRVRVRGRVYRVTASVFNPKLYGTSRFMARHMEVRPGDAVLDVGTGSGILAVVAAETAARVVAVDINHEAVRCARENVAANGLGEKVRVAESDLFAALESGERFDAILFNPPYLEGTPTTPLGHALYDPGKRLLRRFLEGAVGHLAEGGCVQMAYSSIAEPGQALEIAESLGWSHRVVAEKRFMGERLFLYRLTRA